MMKTTVYTIHNGDGTHFIIWHVNFPKYTKNPYKCIKCSNYLLTQSLFPMINIYFSKSTFLSWKWPVLNKELHVQVFSYDMVKYLPLFLNVIISKTSFQNTCTINSKCRLNLYPFLFYILIFYTFVHVTIFNIFFNLSLTVWFWEEKCIIPHLVLLYVNNIWGIRANILIFVIGCLLCHHHRRKPTAK